MSIASSTSICASSSDRNLGSTRAPGLAFRILFVLRVANLRCASSCRPNGRCALGFELPPPKRALNHEVVTFGAVRFVLAFAYVLWNRDPAWTLALGSKRLVRAKYAI